MRLAELLPYREAPALLYHRVASTTPAEEPERLSVPPARFERQMRYLRARGLEAVAVERLIDPAAPRGEGVAITFDDGYLDSYAAAFPILERHRLMATIFVVTGAVGGASAWESGPAPLLSWAHIEEMARHGIRFGSHTRTHVDLTRCEDRAAREELAGSRAELEDRLGREVRALAYPYGRFDTRVMRLAWEAGYRCAFAAGMASRSSPLAGERLRISGGDGRLSFALKASGYGGWARRARRFGVAPRLAGGAPLP